MDEIVSALVAQQAELAALVGPLDEERLARPSRCDGWSVADVLLHLAQTNEMAVASVQNRLAEAMATMAEGLEPASDIDDLAGAMVAKERSTPLTAVRQRWADSASDQAAAFAGCAGGERLLWVAGELAARTLATTRLTETWIHTEDVVAACGGVSVPTDRLRHTARLAWRTLPYAFTRAGVDQHGPVGFDLVAPDGSRWTFAPADEAEEPLTWVRGTAVDLCTVAGQRAAATDTALVADGPDADAVLALVRTFA